MIGGRHTDTQEAREVRRALGLIAVALVTGLAVVGVGSALIERPDRQHTAILVADQG